MRVTIEHIEDKGFFKTSYSLQFHVEFTEQEKTVIKTANLGKYLFFNAQMPDWSDEDNDFDVSSLVKSGGFKFRYSDRAACRSQEPRLREALKTLKSAIEQNAAPATKDTFEL